MQEGSERAALLSLLLLGPVAMTTLATSTPMHLESFESLPPTRGSPSSSKLKDGRMPAVASSIPVAGSGSAAAAAAAAVHSAHAALTVDTGRMGDPFSPLNTPVLIPPPGGRRTNRPTSAVHVTAATRPFRMVGVSPMPRPGSAILAPAAFNVDVADVGAQYFPPFLPGAQMPSRATSMPRLHPRGKKGKHGEATLDQSLERMGEAVYREHEAHLQRQADTAKRIAQAEAAVEKKWREEMARVTQEYEESLAYERSERAKAVAAATKDGERQVRVLEERAAQASRLSGMAQESKLEAIKASMEQHAAEQAAKEKEERIELLRRQVRGARAHMHMTYMDMDMDMYACICALASMCKHTHTRASLSPVRARLLS